MTDVDVDIAVNNFVAFAGCLLLHMHQEPDPGTFCECRLPRPESPACRRRRSMRSRAFRRQAQPHAPLRRPIGARAAHATGARAGPNSGGNADDGGGGSPPHLGPRPAARRLPVGRAAR